MRQAWTRFEIEVLKTKVRIAFYGETYHKGGRPCVDSRAKEYGLTPRFTMDHVIEDQQKRLLEDIISFVGKDNMDEIREVLV